MANNTIEPNKTHNQALSKGLEVLLAQRYEQGDENQPQIIDQSSQPSKAHTISDKFTRVMRQLRQKNSNLTGKKQRGISVGSKINTGLRREYDQVRDNFDATKKLQHVRGDREYVSTELQRFVDKNADTAAGHQIHSPLHNRFDSIRDSDSFNRVGSSSGWNSIL